jgi:K(+)-stimulated pyrophosphate-energized sodium pump
MEQGMVEMIWWVAPISALLSLCFAVYFYKAMMRANEGTATMKEIAQHVREGAYAYLYAQYRVVGIVFVGLFVIFAILAKLGIQNPFVPVAFLTGGLFSGLCGFIGMKTATNASSRTAQGASESLNRGLQVAFRSGAVMGLVVVGFGLLDICAWYWVLDHLIYTADHMARGLDFLGLTLVRAGMGGHEKYVEITTTMLTFGMGASTQALFARVGGGIYTKAADVGADLVGKVEAGIPEDDPRNPATIADNVGDNVGDVAGMGADLYESYCGSILATAALGASLPMVLAGGVENPLYGIKAVMAPMIISGIGILLSIAGCLMVRCGDKSDMKTLMRSLTNPLWFSTAAIAVATAIMAWLGVVTFGIFGSVVTGLVSGCVIGLLTEYYTSDGYKPTQGIAEQAKMGPATTIIDGIAVGMYSSGWSTVTIVIGILASFGFAGGFSNFAMGLYGVGFAAVGMLSTLGFSLATDAYGPIADNAGGNAEMSGLGEDVRSRTDSLDMLGNTTAAIGKGFAIGSAALTAMALLAAYLEEVRLWIGKLGHEAGYMTVGTVTFVVDQAKAAAEGITGGVLIASATMTDFANAYDLTVLNPKLLCGAFVGAMMAFLFCAMTMKAVGRAAGAMVNEVRRQFREIAGIMEGTAKPDYATCVSISTKGAQREMMVPSLMAIVVPVLVGLLLGVSGIVGLLVGSLTSGFVLACMLNNAGGAWDNAKKSIEKQGKTYAADDVKKLHPLTGKGSDAHKASVVGDTVGDPFKDTCGPSLNILIKLMTMVCVVFSGVIAAYGDQLEVLIQMFIKR